MQNFSIASMIVFSIAYIIMFALVLLLYYLTQFAWITVLGIFLVVGFIITIMMASLSN